MKVLTYIAFSTRLVSAREIAQGAKSIFSGARVLFEMKSALNLKNPLFCSQIYKQLSSNN